MLSPFSTSGVDGRLITRDRAKRMSDYRKLAVWEKAHQLTLAVYKATESFPKEELYGLTSQMRRAAISIPSNIAEGTGRGSDPELARFLQIALGSAHEVEYQALLARDLGCLNEEYYQKLYQQIEEVKRMLNGLITRLSINRHKS
jgi:four helix bundle protein